MPSASSYTKTKVDTLLSGYSPSPITICTFKYDDPTPYASAVKFGTGQPDGVLYIPRPTVLDIDHIDPAQVIEYYVHPDLVDDWAASNGMKKATWLSTFGPGMLVHKYMYYFQVATTSSELSWIDLNVHNDAYDNLGNEWYTQKVPQTGATLANVHGSSVTFINDNWPTDDVAINSSFAATDEVLAWQLREARINMVFYPNAVV